jgi:hypothetical protein
MWAERAAAQNERNGYLWVSFCCKFGEGCEKDEQRAVEAIFQSARLGLVDGMHFYALTLPLSDPERYIWLGKGAFRSRTSEVLMDMFAHLDLYDRGVGCGDVLFAIGKALKGQVNVEKGEIFGICVDEDDAIARSQRAIEIYEFFCVAARRAVDAWVHVAIRYKVVKDIRLMVSKMIWNAKQQGDYETQLIKK